MADENIQRTLRRGTAWVGVASGLSGLLDVVSTLACLWLWVSYDELGIATIAIALFPVLDRIAQLGLGQAAVRRADAGPRELSSIWWLNVAAACALLAVSLVAAPAIGAAFGHAIVGSLVCAYAAKLLLQTTQLIPEATLRRELAFDTLSKLKIFAFVAETTAKLGTAYAGGHGHPDLRIWCFVVGPIASTIVMSIGTQMLRPWRPQLVFDRPAAFAAAKFGIQLSLAEMLYFSYTSADYLVIGWRFGATAVGIYRVAYELVLDVVRLVSMVTAEVAFPAFARLSAGHADSGGDREAVGKLLVELTRQNLMMVAPLLVVIGVAAGDLLAIIFPPPYAVTAAQILCIVGALRILSFVLPAMLAGLGHSRDALVYNAIAAVVCPTAFVLAATVWRADGYVAVAWAWALSYPIPFLVLVWLALQRTGVSLRTYARGLAPIVGWAVATAAVTIVVHAALPDDKWLRAIAVAVLTLASYGAFWWSRRRATFAVDRPGPAV
jgi:PST family polysaccharide transporter